MRKLTKLKAAIFAGAAALGPVLATAETANYLYDVNLLGLKVGELKFSVKEEGSRYAAAGKMYPTGLVATVVNFQYDVSVSGNITKSGYRPVIYSEISDNGKRQEEKTLKYNNGIARVQSPKLPKPYWADPKDQKGTVDPMTAIFWVLGDRISDNLCNEKLPIFDGARRVQIDLGPPKTSGTKVICDGVYRRVAGFSADEFKDGKAFPFTMTYEKSGDTYRAQRFEIESVRGRAVIVRR